MQIIQRLIARKWRPGQAAVAGLVATAAYSLAMEGDMSITGSRFSDVRFIQGLMGTRALQQKRFLALSWLLHFINGVALAELYAAVLKRVLPGANWFKEVIFPQTFTLFAR